jgi:ketosteroid isomerase-like protein
MKLIALCLFMMCSIALWCADDKKTEKTAAGSAKSSATEDAIKKMERDMWEGWKNKDMKPFEANISDDSLSLDPMMGWTDKKAMMKSMTDQPCDVRSYSFSDEKIVWIDKDAAIYSLKATVDATCGGQKVPANVYASTVWAKRGAKWQAIFHQETPVMPMQPAAEAK